MSHLARTHVASAAGAGAALARVAEVEALVAGLAGLPPAADEAALDRAARAGTAYDDAMPIIRRRFDALAQETAVWAVEGVEALLAGDGSPPRAAAARLARELTRARRDMERLLELER